MILRVNQVAAEFRKVSNKQMAETTKRTIRENVSINAQLSKMSDKTMELIQENDQLREKEKQMKQQIDMLEFNEKELAKKNSSNQKVNLWKHTFNYTAKNVTDKFLQAVNLKALSHGAIFLATCNAILLLRDAN